MCYKFTTDPPSPPRIDIRSQDNSVNIRIDKNAYMRYVLVSRRELTNTLFGGKFINYVDSTKGELPDAHKDKTVLEAMLWKQTDPDGYSSSLFDLYATQDIKDRCYEALGAPDSTQNFPLDSVAMPNPRSPQWSQQIQQTGLFPLSGMKDWTPYVLIVGAKPENSDSIGFQASGNYSTRTNAKLNADCNFRVDENNIGYLTVRFNTAPYFAVDEDHVYPIDSCLTAATHNPEDKNGVTTDGSGTTDNYVRISAVAPSFEIELSNPTPNNHKNPIGLILQFRVPNPTSGQTLLFTEGLCNADGDVVTDRNNKAVPLRITITSATVNDKTVWSATPPAEWRP